MTKTPKLQEAPQFIRDAMIFPYFGGLTFSQAILKPAGWGGVVTVFAKPPLSTQQILHPALYKSGKVPSQVKLPSIEKLLGASWTKLDENLMGEFGWKEILKQFLGEEKAKPLAAAWDGDRYVVYEQKETKRLILVACLKMDSEEHAERFFGAYADALVKKHGTKESAPRSANFLSLDTPDGGVFLRCFGAECLSVEGTTRAVFDSVDEMIGLPPAPASPKTTAAKQVQKSNAASLRTLRELAPVFE
jgi:hypothetical protein